MPVYNALPYLDDAVRSILDQTFDDFELVILDDASTDGSSERLEAWAAVDSRIRLIQSDRNLGPAKSSNRVAVEASAPIIARMDADDISCPERLETQLAVFERHADVGVVGGLFDIIDAKGQIIRGPEPWRLIRHSVFPPFGNGPLTYRREIFDEVGGYRDQCEYWEDLDLIIRMAAITKIMVVPYSIYQVRQSAISTRIVSPQARVEKAVDLMYRSCDRLLLGANYEDLLAGRIGDTKLDPRVFISLGSLALWADGHPMLFRRLIKRGRIRFDIRSAGAFVWTGWASLDPRSLRAFLRIILFLRNRVAMGKIHSREPLRWRPGLAASAANETSHSKSLDLS